MAIAGRNVFILFCILAGLIIPSALSAEIQSSVRIDLKNSLALNPDSDPAPEDPAAVYGINGSGRFTLDARGNRNVKGHLSLLANVSTIRPESSEIILDKMYLGIRFDSLRLTIGKTIISWGEGFVFNSGDLLADSGDLNVNFSAEELRDNSAWLGSIYIPIDRFSFLEALILPPMPFVDPAPLTDLPSFGGRFLTEFADISLKLEGGYLFKGMDDLHQVYVSLQGGEGLNWFLNSSISLSEEHVGGSAEDFFTGLQASGGLFFFENFIPEDGGSEFGFGMRAELLVDLAHPFSVNADAGGMSGVSGAVSPLGIYGYAETSFTVDRIFTASLRSIVSPIDLSAIIIAQGSFNLYQGFTLYFTLNAQIGEDGDTFANHRLGGYGAEVGVGFIF